MLGSILTIGGSLLGGLIASDAQRGAAKSAAEAQTEAARLGIEEQKRQFDEIQRLLSPYVEGGKSAFEAQQQLIGLGGPALQRKAIEQLSQSPELRALQEQGEQSILQQASATGGVRGGNVQGILAQYRPKMLSNLIQQRYSQLGNLSQIGQGAAMRKAGFGQQLGGDVSQLMQQQGAAQAASEIVGGRARAGLFREVLPETLGQLGGVFGGGFGGFQNIGEQSGVGGFQPQQPVFV